VIKPSYEPPAQEHPFACYVRILGKGKSGSRALSQDEARHAFGMMLRGEAEPLQQGAFLMLLRVKEETGEELAGFVQACRDTMLAPPGELQADLDWSSYAGKKHQHPWFILSMLLLSGAGHRVFIHGSDGHTPGRLYTEGAMRQLGLPVADDWPQVEQQLDESLLSYLPLRHFCYPLHEMMQLRPLLGLRSPVNTLARMINPLRAPSSIQSVFHPAYASLHQQTDAILGQPRALVFKGDSGEVEIKPQADTRLHLLWLGKTQELSLTRSLPLRVASKESLSVEPLKALWHGNAIDDYGLDATVATTAAALIALQAELSLESATEQANKLWQERDKSRLS
jgi:anthranilate phosphoribosyltransferase